MFWSRALSSKSGLLDQVLGVSGTPSTRYQVYLYLVQVPCSNVLGFQRTLSQLLLLLLLMLHGFLCLNHFVIVYIRKPEKMKIIKKREKK